MGTGGTGGNQTAPSKAEIRETLGEAALDGHSRDKGRRTQNLTVL